MVCDALVGSAIGNVVGLNNTIEVSVTNIDGFPVADTEGFSVGKLDGGIVKSSDIVVVMGLFDRNAEG